jgi:hypothetical protein
MIFCPSIILYYPHSNNWGWLCKKLRHWPTILVCLFPHPPPLEIPNRLTNGSHLASKTGRTSANFISSYINSLHLQQLGVIFCYMSWENRKGNLETINQKPFCYHLSNFITIGYSMLVHPNPIYVLTGVGQFLKWGTNTCWLSTWVNFHLPIDSHNIQRINFGI